MADTYVVERVQTGVRIEKRMLKVLKALAEYLDMTLGDLLEGIVLHAFEGKSPFVEETLAKIEQIKGVYGLDLDSSASHNLTEAWALLRWARRCTAGRWRRLGSGPLYRRLAISQSASSATERRQTSGSSSRRASSDSAPLDTAIAPTSALWAIWRSWVVSPTINASPARTPSSSRISVSMVGFGFEGTSSTVRLA